MYRLPDIKQIWFDFDNTLADRNKAMEQCLLEWLKEHTQLDDDSTALLMEEAMHMDNWGYTTRTEFAEWLQKRTGTENIFIPVELARSILRKVPPYIRPYASTESVLKSCLQKYRIGILTNGPSDVQREKIRHSELVRFFKEEDILVSGEIGFDKPDPRVFEHLIKCSGVKAHEILYVGDDARNDVYGAALVNMPSCWVSHGRTFPKEISTLPDFTISSIKELPDLLI